MPKNNLTSEQQGYLCRLWDGGMTTVIRTDLISNAMENTGLDKKTIRNWIGNEKSRQGMAVNRGPRDHKPEKYLPGKMRKITAYSAFKSDFLASDAAKQLKLDGASSGEIQKQGSVIYQQLSSASKEIFAQLAASTNTDLPSATQITKEKMIKRLINNIHANMKQLDGLGCPSIWLGYGGNVPERLYSPQMAELAEDDIFTNYVVSSMVNKLDSAQTISSINQSDEVEILNIDGEKVGCGEVTSQTIVHGYEVKDGWIPIMVHDILPNIKPWDEFPTHSDMVEKDSFVAWPKAHVRPKKSSH